MTELYLKMPDNTDDLQLSDDKLYTLDLRVDFRGEMISSSGSLEKKLNQLFSGNTNPVEFKDIRVTKLRGFLVHQVVVDKINFLILINHQNYGDFEGDYSIRVLNYSENEQGKDDVNLHPDSPLKLVPTGETRSGFDKELTITIRRSADENSAPARGLVMHNLLSEKREMIRVLQHFNLIGKLTRAAKPTPSIPTIEVALTESVADLVQKDAINTDPLLIYDPTPQMKDSGGSQLWAHIDVDKGPRAKKLTIEGVVGRTNLEEIIHRLRYHGELLAEPVKNVWSSEGDDPVFEVETGELTVVMKLRVELNFIFYGNTAYKVFYPSQPAQCSQCYSWSHKIASCYRRDESRLQLMQDHVAKWKEQVGYQPRETGTIQDRSTQLDSSDESTEEVEEDDPTKPAVTPKKDDAETDHLTPQRPKKLDYGLDGSDAVSGQGGATSHERLPDEEKDITPKMKQNASEVKKDNELREKQDKAGDEEDNQSLAEDDSTNTDAKPADKLAGKFPASPGEKQDLRSGKPEISPKPKRMPRMSKEPDVASTAKLLDSPASILSDFKDTYEEANAGEEALTKDFAGNGEEVKNGEQSGTEGGSETEGWERVMKQRKPKKETKQPKPAKREVSNKRKAPSPLMKELKTSGSGRKIYAEKLKSTFFAKALRIKENALKAGESTVKKEKCKKDLEILTNESKEAMFNNDNGPVDPSASENWDEMMRERDDILEILTKKKK